MEQYLQQLEEEMLGANGGGSVNVSENEVCQASATFADPNSDPLENFFADEEIETCIQDFVNSLQSKNDNNMARETLDQNQINCSTPQNHTSPPNPPNVAVNQQSEVMMLTRTPTDVAANSAMPMRSSLHVPLTHQTKEPRSVSNVPMRLSRPIMHQFNPQMHHHLPNPTVQLSPQVPSSVPVVHMPPPVNQFNQQQNITPSTVPISSMPTPAGSVLHRTQPHHMSPAMTRFPQISTSSPFHIAPQNHIVHSVPPITHQCNPQNLFNGDQYYPQPHHHELPPSMISPKFSFDSWLLFNGQHLVNHPLYSYLEALIDVHSVINKGKHWSEKEHMLFLYGMLKYRRRNWKEISRNVLKTRTPSQIASHAQKFFDHQEKKMNNNNNNTNNNNGVRRESIYDITYSHIPEFFQKLEHHHQQQQNHVIVSYQNQFVPPSSLPIHDRLYYPQNPTNI